MRMSNLVFDIEADGLDPTKIHCIVAQDVDTKDVFTFDNTQLDEGYALLKSADKLIGHNIIGYDIPVVERIAGIDLTNKKIVDTLVLSRLFKPTREGNHGLEGWGYRLGFTKGDFGEQEDAWECYTPEMLEYCKRDVLLNRKVYDALTDPETRYRQRYVDLVVNPHVKETFVKRSKIISSMRSFLNSKEYLEVETPILQSIPGGAAARPFVTHHNALDIPLYLRIANELYLKRLIVGGFDGVYEFAKDFRNEGMDRTHNPEFTQMEIYVAYKDYHWMMNFTEDMIEFICNEVLGTTQVQIGKEEVNFKKPFRRISMTDSILEHTGIDISNMSEKELREACKSIGVEVSDSMGKGKLIDEIFGENSSFKKQIESASQIVLLENPSDKELVNLYQHALFTIYMPKYEGFGLPILESLTFKKPVIVSDIPVFRELFSGLVLFSTLNNNGNLRGLVEELLETHKSWTEKFSKSGALVAKFSYEKAANKLDEVIHQMKNTDYGKI